jgi:hypothetical protein
MLKFQEAAAAPLERQHLIFYIIATGVGTDQQQFLMATAEYTVDTKYLVKQVIGNIIVRRQHLDLQEHATERVKITLPNTVALTVLVDG